MKHVPKALKDGWKVISALNGRHHGKCKGN